MELRCAARWMAVGWLAVGCEPRHPDFRAAPDVVSSPDVPTQDALDAAFDVAVTTPDVTSADAAVTAPDVTPSDVAITTPDDIPVSVDVPDVALVDIASIDVGSVDARTPVDVSPIDAATDVPTTVDAVPVDVGPTTTGSATESCALTGAATVTAPGHYALSGSTSGRANDHRPSCASADGADVGYLVTLTALSRVTWSARATGMATAFVPVVYVTQSCTEQASDDHRFRDEAACVDHAATATGTVDLPAGSYYLVVDGSRSGGSATAGAFDLVLDVSAVELSAAYSQERVMFSSCSAIPSSATRLPGGDDVVSPVAALGFPFNYFGRPFDRLAYNSNGFFTFVVSDTSPSSDGTWRNHSLPFSGLPRGVVAPFWDDLVAGSMTGSSGGVYFWIDGASPSRVAHVFWSNVSFYRDRVTTVSFEARLFQTTDVIEFAYCAENRLNSFSRGGEATIGLESFEQTAGRLVSLNRTGAVAPNTGYRFTPR